AGLPFTNACRAWSGDAPSACVRLHKLTLSAAAPPAKLGALRLKLCVVPPLRYFSENHGVNVYGRKSKSKYTSWYSAVTVAGEVTVTGCVSTNNPVARTACPAAVGVRPLRRKRASLSVYSSW